MSSLKDTSESFTQGWLPIKNEKEQEIVDYLEKLGICTLVVVEKHQSSQSFRCLDELTPIKQTFNRKISLTLDSELFCRRSFRMASDNM